MESTDLCVIFENFGLAALFKDYLENVISSEYVTAYFMLRNIMLSSPLRRRRKQNHFYTDYVLEGSLRELLLSSELKQEITENKGKFTAQIMQSLMDEIHAILEPHWGNFILSQEYRQYAKGKIIPRMELKLNRKESDEEVISYHKKNAKAF